MSSFDSDRMELTLIWWISGSRRRSSCKYDFDSLLFILLVDSDRLCRILFGDFVVKFVQNGMLTSGSRFGYGTKRRARSRFVLVMVSTTWLWSFSIFFFFLFFLSFLSFFFLILASSLLEYLDNLVFVLFVPQEIKVVELVKITHPRYATNHV